MLTKETVMESKKRIVIVGGVAAGATAAARARRVDAECEIVLVERGPYISYANCGLPYFLSGDIKERSSLLLQTPEGFSDKYGVDVRVETEAVERDGPAAFHMSQVSLTGNRHLRMKSFSETQPPSRRSPVFRNW